jgi:hypothetical protein
MRLRHEEKSGVTHLWFDKKIGYTKAINEGKFDYETYHETLASCFNEAEKYVTKRGYEPIEFELSDPQHVAYGQKEEYHKELKVDGKLQRKMLHVIIYRMDSGTYELTMYFN